MSTRIRTWRSISGCGCWGRAIPSTKSSLVWAVTVEDGLKRGNQDLSYEEDSAPNKPSCEHLILALRRAPVTPRVAKGAAAALTAPSEKHLLRRRRRPVDLRLARREVDNILRFDHDSPAPRSSASSATTAPPRTSSPPPRISSPTTRAERQDAAHRGRARPKGRRSPPAGTSEEEARGIGEEIEQLQRDDGRGQPHNLDEIAILVRASFQMREFEDRFVTLGLPYRVIGGPRFYERMEIRDALAYLR